MQFAILDIEIFSGLVVLLGAIFVALICDFLKGNNEQLRERNVELRTRQEERERLGIFQDPRQWIQALADALRPQTAAAAAESAAATAMNREAEAFTPLRTDAEAEADSEMVETESGPMRRRMYDEIKARAQQSNPAWASKEELEQLAERAARIRARHETHKTHDDKVRQDTEAQIEIERTREAAPAAIERIETANDPFTQLSRPAPESDRPKPVVKLVGSSAMMPVYTPDLSPAPESILSFDQNKPGFRSSISLPVYVPESTMPPAPPNVQAAPPVESISKEESNAEISRMKVLPIDRNAPDRYDGPVEATALDLETEIQRVADLAIADVRESIEARAADFVDLDTEIVELAETEIVELPEPALEPLELVELPLEPVAMEQPVLAAAEEPVEIVEPAAVTADPTPEPLAEAAYEAVAEPVVEIAMPEPEVIAEPEIAVAEIAVAETPAAEIPAAEIPAAEIAESVAAVEAELPAFVEVPAAEIPTVPVVSAPAPETYILAPALAAAIQEAAEREKAEVLELPAGLQEASVLHRLIESGMPFSGVAVAIGVNDSNGLKEKLASSSGVDSLAALHRMVQSMLRPQDFACQFTDDEFVLLYPGESGPSAQRRLFQVSEKLWDFQLRSLGHLSVMFSWGGLEVQNERLNDAVASARERMYQTRRNRKGSSLEGSSANRRRVANG